MTSRRLRRGASLDKRVGSHASSFVAEIGPMPGSSSRVSSRGPTSSASWSWQRLVAAIASMGQTARRADRGDAGALLEA